MFPLLAKKSVIGFLQQILRMICDRVKALLSLEYTPRSLVFALTVSWG
ncbi:hypothetical protein HMPREF1015_01498 [Bacillus smithii 7_3_47FAA]|jgi:hypothetical protein|uniref:Uncharacterized protein n=1 Tax=Bacillus smithii 7_3_47FAA TaxID=665952 RepID=G9QJV9_9BACI|nr:hypothetical protein HMPREF1015_01498 [Bacillus smithii 7_3_47FAA]